VSRPGHVVRLADPDEVAASVADRVHELLARAQESRGTASVVLTGGSISRKVHRGLPAQAADLDWSNVDVWWGDERFVPTDDPERNAGQAREDLVERVALDASRVHQMPSSDDLSDVAAAAASYAQELRDAVVGLGPDEPWFDVLMLGIGPDGHCASLFPGRPQVTSSADVLPVIDSPKPPPQRVSLGMTVLQRARHVIFAATGDEKADAVARSVAGGDVVKTPSAGPRGLESTTWYVDSPAATLLD
jgi:6-phosphogluconolactonase